MKLQRRFSRKALGCSIFAILGIASSASLVVHERRDDGLEVLSRGSRLAPSTPITISIAVRQRNLENAQDYLSSISHPESAQYGRSWSVEQVVETFAPSEESFDAITAWLGEGGIRGAGEKDGWLRFDSTVAHVEAVLHTEYYVYGDDCWIGCDEYSLPQHVSERVDYILPGIALAPRQSVAEEAAKSSERVAARSTLPRHTRRTTTGIASSSIQRRNASIPADLQNCGTHMTPACLRALYNLPTAHEIAENYTSDSANAVGVYEYQSGYKQKDLDKFFAKFAPQVPAGTHPDLVAIDGVELSEDFDLAEAEVDVDILSSLVYPQNITYYDVKSKYSNSPDRNFFRSFPVAIDDLLSSLQNSSTRVVSLSWGLPEILFPNSVLRRQCNEFMKLSLRGVTFTVASGDYGVASELAAIAGDFYTNGCIVRGNVSATTNPNGPTENGTAFVPMFPQSCPYVLSCGATQLNRGQTVNDPESGMYVPSVFGKDSAFAVSTAGGFSNVFHRPSYQDKTVEAYYSVHDPSYPYYNLTASSNRSAIGINGGRYNRVGRGFPDVSANGVNFQYYDNGEITSQDGASLAAPVWAAVFTLINEKRSQAGKGPVGFVNPVLYAHPEVFNDITKGRNPGCGTEGFEAVEGWDPVTGLGTPDFGKLVDLFLELP